MTKIVKNIISAAGGINSLGNEDHGEFLWNLYGNYYDFSSDTDLPQLIVTSQNSYKINKWVGEGDYSYIVYADSVSFLLDEEGNTTPKDIKQPGFDYDEKVYENFTVKRITDEQYLFVNNKTGESVIWEEEDEFLGEYKGFFYFHRYSFFDDLNCILKMDFQFEIVDKFEMDVALASSFKGCGPYAFCKKKSLRALF